MALLSEAGQAGSQLGSDYNHRWTAFGPVNVLLHRVHAAVRLGDAGSEKLPGFLPGVRPGDALGAVLVPGQGL